MKKYVFLIVVGLLLLIIISLCVQLFYINQKYDNFQMGLAKDVENVKEILNNSDHVSASDLSTIENDIASIKNDSNKTYNNTELKGNINDLNSKYNYILNSTDQIDDLENKINDLEKKISLLSDDIIKGKTNFSNSSVSNSNNKIIKSWKTTVIDNVYSTDSHEETQETYVTVYEFKENGDFYINKNKVGTYSNNYILLKDSNDTNFRVANYYYVNDTLYMNLYFNTKDIVISTDFYECDSV